MLDLHNHMLPGLDDGAADWAQSLAMARLSVRDGVRGVVCTPHWMPGRFENRRSAVLDALELLRMKLAEQHIPLSVYPGAELRLDPDLCRRIECGDLLTLGDSGRYVLIELPEEMLPPNLESLFWELERRGITPVVAHPERNVELFRDPERIYRWVESGVLVQITAAGLTGWFGREVRRFARLLLEHRLVHIVASDAHDSRLRTPKLTAAFSEVAKTLGVQAAREMTHDIPHRIVRGQAVAPSVPIHPQSSRFRMCGLRRFFFLCS